MHPGFAKRSRVLSLFNKVCQARHATGEIHEGIAKASASYFARAKSDRCSSGLEDVGICCFQPSGMNPSRTDQEALFPPHC
jgi:hypothetical protein